MKRLILLVGVLVFSTIGSNGQDLAKIPSDNHTLTPIILILDGSGSMWGQIDGQTKIEIARRVVGDLLDNMDTNQPIGLVVYGHRKKGDCQDIETLLESSTNNHSKIKSLLANVSPVGKTPLANTAVLVIEQLKSINSGATVILVSDGAESCGGDLCAVVKAAKEAGVDFVLHIVGFDIGESDKLALQCAAREGDGVYLDASNAAELGDALERATELTIEDAEPTLSVKVTKNGILHDAVVQIFRLNEKNDFIARRTYDHAATNPTLFHIPAGTYHISAEPMASDVAIMWKKDIVVSGEGITKFEFDFTSGKISIHTTANDILWDCVVRITNTQDSEYAAGGRTYKSSRTNPMIKELDSGIYMVQITAQTLEGQSISYSFSEVEVIGGETVEIAHNFEYGELSILSTNNGKIWDTVLNIYKTGDPKKKSYSGGRTYKSASSNPKRKLLTLGTYSVIYKPHHIYGDGREHTIDNLEVKSGEITKSVHDYKTGVARIGATHDDVPWKSVITIYQNGRSIYSKISNTAPKEVVLIAGTYDVTVKPRQLDAPLKKFSITIEEGETVERVIEF